MSGGLDAGELLNLKRPYNSGFIPPIPASLELAGARPFRLTSNQLASGDRAGFSGADHFRELAQCRPIRTGRD